MMKKINYCELTNETLLKEFYKDHTSLFVYNQDELIGAITYNSYIKNDNIYDMIKKVYIVESKDYVEIGDLENIYCIQNGDELTEVSKMVDPRYIFTIERFKQLYNDNDIIDSYFKKTNYNKIYITGDNKDYIYNFIAMYGIKSEIISIGDTDIISIISNETCNALIIDTTGFNIELYKKVCNLSKSVVSVCDLKELSALSEMNYFVDYFSKIDGLDTFVFSFPDIKEIPNLTLEETKRIAFDHYYKFYFDAYLKRGDFKELLKKVLKENFTEDFIKSRYIMPKVYNRNGCLFLEPSDNPYCQSINGIRSIIGLANEEVDANIDDILNYIES